MSTHTPIEKFYQPQANAEEIDLSQLVIVDPCSQEGLVKRIPSGQIPVRYKNRYKTMHKVRCAFCEQRQSHNTGFTAVMSDGRIALCGKDCGRKYFGDDAARKLESEIQSAINQAAATEIKRRCFLYLPALIEEIERVWLPLDFAAREVVSKVPTMRKSLIKSRMTPERDLLVIETGSRHDDVVAVVKAAYLLEQPRPAFRDVVGDCRAILKGRNDYGLDVSEERRIRLARDLQGKIKTACSEMADLKSFLTRSNIAALRKAVRFYFHGNAQVQWVKRYGRPVMRIKRGSNGWENYEIPDMPALPEANTLIPDLIPKDVV